MSATRATKPSGADPRDASAEADAEITPRPAPASAERTAAGPASGRFDRHEELARPGDGEAPPPELRDNPFVEYILSLSPEEEARDLLALDAHREAESLYGDDPARILKAIEEGAHPLQRGRSAGR
ncbi:MAG: hypothetical protein R3B70_21800 [Polyangiaceae bacterium]